MKSMESMPPSTAGEETPDKPELSEAEAEILLDELLDNPDNAFLLSVPKNKEAIEEAPTALEALTFAQERILRRTEKAMDFRIGESVEGVKITNVSYAGMRENINSIVRNADEIGRGDDGFVVIDRSEVKNLPPEICYKFALKEATPRGRNSMQVEFEVQGKFFRSAKESPECKIGVPTPFYSVEIGNQKMIAMEKLNAKSVEDILAGKGRLPSWFDVDAFCSELKKIIDHFHEDGLYHRDMHIGNVMIAQSETLKEGDYQGYIVDFGLSGIDSVGFDPYKKVVAGTTFTYGDDYGIINEVKRVLSHRSSVKGI